MNLCVESMPETDFGMPGMTQIMARPAFQRIQHAGHVRKFGMPGMPEILAREACWVLISFQNLGFSRRWWESHGTSKYAYLQGMQISVACQFKCKNTLGPPPLLPVSKSLTIGMGKILACQMTNTENVAEMSSVAESCPRGGFKIQNFLTWRREFSSNSM